MTIFNVVYAEAGGGMRSVANSYENLLRSENIKVISLRLGKSKKKCEDSNFYFLRSSGHFNVFSMVKALAILIRYKPAVVICHCSRSLSIFSPATRILGIKTMGVTHNDKLWKFRKTDHMIAFSTPLRTILIAMGMDTKKISLIANPITSPKAIYSFNTHATKEPLTLGFISRLESRKGAHVAIRALHYLKEQKHRATLLIAGDGPQKLELKELVTLYKLEEQVKFLDWVRDIESFYQKIDVLLVPTNYESFGLTIAEAFARKTLVITNDFHCFAHDYFKDNHNLILASERSGEAYAKKIITLSALNLFQIVENAYETYETEFHTSHIQKKLTELLQNLSTLHSDTF